MEKGIAKYYLVKENIYTEIKRGKYKIGDKILGERKIAEKYHVSHMTARQAISLLVEEGILVRKHGEGTFVIRKTREKLPSISNNIIFVFLPAPKEKTIFPYKLPVVRKGVLEGVYEKIAPFYFHTNVVYYSLTHFENTLEKLLKIKPAGVVIWYEDTSKARKILKELYNEGIKFILVDKYPEIDIPISYVVGDNFYGGYKMTEYLINTLNHSNVLYLTTEIRCSSLRERAEGYLEAMKRNKLKPRIIEIRDDIPKKIFEKYAWDIIKKRENTCLFVSNDGIVIKLIQIYEKMGVKVPDDISIAGYDDIEISSHFKVPLTTMKQDFYKMGEIAAEILLNWNEIPENDSSRQVKIKPILKIRKSTKRR